MKNIQASNTHSSNSDWVNKFKYLQSGGKYITHLQSFEHQNFSVSISRAHEIYNLKLT